MGEVFYFFGSRLSNQLLTIPLQIIFENIHYGIVFVDVSLQKRVGNSLIFSIDKLRQSNKFFAIFARRDKLVGARHSDDDVGSLEQVLVSPLEGGLVRVDIRFVKAFSQ